MKTTDDHAEPEVGKVKLVEALAVSAGTLMLVGQKRVASLVALCALAIGGGNKKSQEKTPKNAKELTKTGGRAKKVSAQEDGKPPEEGGATTCRAQDGKPLVDGEPQ